MPIILFTSDCMVAKILDGKKASQKILLRVKKSVLELKKAGIPPKLVVIQVGSDTASSIYIEKKRLTATLLGIDSEVKRFSPRISFDELAGEILSLNSDKSVHGILIQMPLPKQLTARGIYELISISKDVDGFHPYNHGKSLLGEEALRPATPAGIMRLLANTKAKVGGKNAVIIGRSNIVGKPLSLMLMNAGCTVTVCNSRTKRLGEHTKRADILVSAVGKPKLVKAGMVKKGAIVIDVGINRLRSGKVVGDVDFEAVRKKASWITPVPGGVGPMTIAILMENMAKAAGAEAWQK